MMRAGEEAGCGSHCAEDCSCLRPSFRGQGMLCNGCGMDITESYSLLSILDVVYLLQPPPSGISCGL